MNTSFPGRLQCLFFFFAMSRRGAAQRSLHRCLTEVRVSFLIPYANNSFLHVFLEATSDDRIHFCRILHVKKADLALGLHCVGSKGKQIHSTHQRATDIFMGNSMQKKTCTCYVNAPLEKKKKDPERVVVVMRILLQPFTSFGCHGYTAGGPSSWTPRREQGEGGMLGSMALSVATSPLFPCSS